jgi:hypothetical protein
MTARMVNAIATANTNLAGFDFGFGAMVPSWLQHRTFRGANREKWVSHFTLRMIIIFMETIKEIFIRLDSSLAAMTAFAKSWRRET